MKFKQIDINCFKSFPDQISFPIDKGLTGIVGPNGCGKSNIVEALKWVMGETSAKSLRGAGMEDVIFNGTSDRPSKNFCEVTLKLDSDGKKSISENLGNIEVRRRLEKDKGSKYFLNGKEVIDNVKKLNANINEKTKCKKQKSINKSILNDRIRIMKDSLTMWTAINNILKCDGYVVESEEDDKEEAYTFLSRLLDD